jgi:hypothetical protein
VGRRDGNGTVQFRFEGWSVKVMPFPFQKGAISPDPARISLLDPRFRRVQTGF